MSALIHRRLDDLPFLGLAVALGCGLFFPQWFTSYYAVTGFFLQFIFFTSGLRIDTQTVLSELRDFKLFLVVVVLRLIAFPIFVYAVMSQFFPSLVIPLVLLAAMPAGMTSPLFVDMIRGNVPLSLLLTAGTSLLSVVTLPLMLGLLGGESLLYDPWTMFRTLFFIMLLPLIIAQCVRSLPFGRLVIHQGRGLTRVGSILALWLLIATIASKHSDALLGSFTSSSIPMIFLIMTMLLLLFHWVSYMVCFWRSRTDRITVTLSLSYMNFTLAIFLAETLFRDPPVILVVILSMLPWNLGLLLFQWLVRHNSWTISDKPVSSGGQVFPSGHA